MENENNDIIVEKELMDRLVNYYVEIEEYKKQLEEQQQSIEITINQYLEKYDIKKSYKTKYVKVTKKNSNKTSKKDEINKYINKLIDNDLKETVSSVDNKDLIAYLAAEKKMFEEFRLSKLPQENKDKHEEIIRDFIIEKERYDLLQINKKMLHLVVGSMLPYSEAQRVACKEILNKIEKSHLIFRRM